MQVNSSSTSAAIPMKTRSMTLAERADMECTTQQSPVGSDSIAPMQAAARSPLSERPLLYPDGRPVSPHYSPNRASLETRRRRNAIVKQQFEAERAREAEAAAGEPGLKPQPPPRIVGFDSGSGSESRSPRRSLRSSYQ